MVGLLMEHLSEMVQVLPESVILQPALTRGFNIMTAAILLGTVLLHLQKELKL